MKWFVFILFSFSVFAQEKLDYATRLDGVWNIKPNGGVDINVQPELNIKTSVERDEYVFKGRKNLDSGALVIQRDKKQVIFTEGVNYKDSPSLQISIFNQNNLLDSFTECQGSKCFYFTEANCRAINAEVKDLESLNAKAEQCKSVIEQVEKAYNTYYAQEFPHRMIDKQRKVVDSVGGRHFKGVKIHEKEEMKSPSFFSKVLTLGEYTKECKRLENEKAFSQVIVPVVEASSAGAASQQ
jgi:hypothetical protein